MLGKRTWWRETDGNGDRKTERDKLEEQSVLGRSVRWVVHPACHSWGQRLWAMGEQRRLLFSTEGSWHLLIWMGKPHTDTHISHSGAGLHNILSSPFFSFFFKAEAIKIHLNFHHMRPHWWKKNSDTSKDYLPHFGGKKADWLPSWEWDEKISVSHSCLCSKYEAKATTCHFHILFFWHRLSKKDTTWTYTEPG